MVAFITKINSLQVLEAESLRLNVIRVDTPEAFSFAV